MRGKTAIIGAADTQVCVVPSMSATPLCADAILKALADAGLGKDAVDGLVTCNSMAEPFLYHAEAIAEYLQVSPRYCISIGAGGGTTFTALHQAASAILSGICSTVVIAMADSLRSGLSRQRAAALQASAGHPQFESPYHPTVPAFYALIARAHMHEYGTMPEQFAAVAVSAPQHAGRNPSAQMRTPIGVEDVLASRMIADPLHLLDCSLVSDGGAANVLTSANRAVDARHRPVYLLGAGAGHSHEHISQAKSLTTSAAVESGKRAFEMAGVGPRDLQSHKFTIVSRRSCWSNSRILGFVPRAKAGYSSRPATRRPVARCRSTRTADSCPVTPRSCSARAPVCERRAQCRDGAVLGGVSRLPAAHPTL